MTGAPLRGMADLLCLAAAPLFAVMAALTALAAGPPETMADMMCIHTNSPIDGMAPMYALMAAVHAAPWLRRLAGR